MVLGVLRPTAFVHPEDREGQSPRTAGSREAWTRDGAQVRGAHARNMTPDGSRAAQGEKASSEKARAYVRECAPNQLKH